jgi:Phosphotransferase enzyme family
VEIRLDGGNTGGAVRVGDTVRRTAGPWTPAVQALLAHLARQGFAGSPQPLGVDEHGREVLTFLPGETVGSARPWPAWVYAEHTLVQVAAWVRSFHQAVADYAPPADAVWRMGGRWAPGLIIGHNDAAPYNAVWRDGRLAGFFDWDMAGPVTAEWDVAFAAFSWVPLHAEHVVAREGFSDFAGRPRRLQLFLTEYGWTGSMPAFLEVVAARIQAHVTSLRGLAAQDPVFARIVAQGGADDLEAALAGLAHFR